MTRHQIQRIRTQKKTAAVWFHKTKVIGIREYIRKTIKEDLDDFRNNC